MNPAVIHMCRVSFTLVNFYLGVRERMFFLFFFVSDFPGKNGIFGGKEGKRGEKGGKEGKRGEKGGEEGMSCIVHLPPLPLVFLASALDDGTLLFLPRRM